MPGYPPYIYTQRDTSPVAAWGNVGGRGPRSGPAGPVAMQAVFDCHRAAGIGLAAMPPEAAALALDAFDRFGEGRHPAPLKMGDRFAYACSRHFREPLMFKGGDSALADIEPAPGLTPPSRPAPCS